MGLNHNLALLESRALALCQKLYRMRQYVGLNDRTGMRAAAAGMREDAQALVSLTTLVEDAAQDLTAELKASLEALGEKTDGNA